LIPGCLCIGTEVSQAEKATVERALDSRRIQQRAAEVLLSLLIPRTAKVPAFLLTQPMGKALVSRQTRRTVNPVARQTAAKVLVSLLIRHMLAADQQARVATVIAVPAGTKRELR
jgi:hypothetical protein